MSFVELGNGTKIEAMFFNKRLSELKKEKWVKKSINELPVDHLNCELTFETISKDNSEYYYESNLGSFISISAYENYVKES